MSLGNPGIVAACKQACSLFTEILPHPSRLLTANTALRNVPDKEWLGLQHTQQMCGCVRNRSLSNEMSWHVPGPWVSKHSMDVGDRTCVYQGL